MVYKKVIRPLMEFRDVRTLAYLWNKCYKMGVEHAYRNGNKHFCLDWVADRREDGKYAQLDDETEYFFEKWTALMLSWTYDLPTKHWSRVKSMFAYIHGKKNFLTVMFPLCMEFYLCGIEDYCDRPNPKEVSLFLKTDLAFWNKPRTYMNLTDSALFIAEKARWYCLNKDLAEKQYHFFARALEVACNKNPNKKYA